MSEPYYGTESVSAIAGLTALLRAGGMPLREAATQAEERWRTAQNARNGRAYGRAELIEFLASFER